AQDALGQFDYADKIVKLVLAIVTATGTVMLPHVANKFAKGDVKGVRQSLYNCFEFVTALAVPKMFGLMAVAKKFAFCVLGVKYVPIGTIMFIEAPVIFFIAWSNVSGSQYLMPVKRVNEFTASVTDGALTYVLLNFFLIPHYMSNGAAVATVIADF